MEKNYTVTSFAALSIEEQKKIVKALIDGAAQEWGDECMPATGIGDNRIFNMNEISAWIDSL